MSPSLTGWKYGELPGLFTGRSTPYFLKKMRHFVQRRGLGFPALLQSFETATKKFIHTFIL